MLEHAYARMTIVLVGNKKDLDEEREVSYDEGLEFARKNKLIFFETSAKTSENVDQTFIHATKIIYNNIARGEYDLANESIGIKPGNVPASHQAPGSSSTVLGAKQEPQKKADCC